MKQQDNIAMWNKRASEVSDDDQVTHPDLYQKRLENDYLVKRVKPGMQVLEAGCGNGFFTQGLREKAALVDAFDASENMVERARKRVSSRNGSFFVKALPEPETAGLKEQYDLALTVRVLINLENQEQQARAVSWIADRLAPGGLFLLLEGNQDGLDHLNSLRVPAGLEPLKPPSYNINLTREWVLETVAPLFEVVDDSGIGPYDFLTRFHYPLVVGNENVAYNTDFHKAAYTACQVMKDGQLREYSRMLMMTLKKK